MTTGTAVLVHPAMKRLERPGVVRRTGTLAAELLVVAALLAVGTAAIVLLLLLVLLSAPVFAGILGWLLWRSGDSTARRAARVRARLRRRARALGLVVLAGSQPAVARFVAAGPKSPTGTGLR